MFHPCHRHWKCGSRRWKNIVSCLRRPTTTALHHHNHALHALPSLWNIRRGASGTATMRKTRATKKKSHIVDAPSEEEATSKLTPMMAQYFRIKRQHEGYVLLFRMGDFYEAFFDDAKIMSSALDITLTTRGKRNGEPIPMCGVPHHAIDTYLHRMVKRGMLVAVCEQIEDPSAVKRERGKIVERDVTRLVTPGTITEDNYLDAREHNYLVAITSTMRANRYSPEEQMLGLAWLDISTGEFHTAQVPVLNIQSELLKLQPSEVIVSQHLASSDHHIRKSLIDYHATIRPFEKFEVEEGVSRKLLNQHFDADNINDLSLLEATASAMLIDYVLETQKGKMPHLDPISRVDIKKNLYIDVATRKSLEIDRTLSGQKKGSLLSVMDQTVTGPGSRLLQTFMRSPLLDVQVINARLDCVQFFFNDMHRVEEIQYILKSTSDIERSLQRISLQRGGPRDFESIAETLLLSTKLADTIVHGQIMDRLPRYLQNEIESLRAFGAESVISEIKRAIRECPPISTSDGGFIRCGYSQKLDEIISLRDHSSNLISELQQEYRQLTGVTTLKIKNTGNHGYFVEVPVTQKDKMVMHSSVFHPMQSMTNSVRYRTEKLNTLQDKISKAHMEALQIELQLFDQISQQVMAKADIITRAARSLSAIDVFSSLALLARNNHYVRPELHELSSSDNVFHVENGRHPIVESHQLLSGRASKSFVANDCIMRHNDKHLILITGPNMSGKSVYLRQNALIILMAQMGSFVPADMAEFSVADALFSRVGASDNLANDQSTFMMEMMETANILNQSSRNSFVIVDEIGRGTANFDGLSIAWAVLEHIHNKTGCRALFSTHYHELVDLDQQLEKMACYCLNVREVGNEIVFTHKIVPGNADQSYGIHVAEMAGVPKAVIDRASQILSKLNTQKPDLQSIVAQHRNSKELSTDSK